MYTVQLQQIGAQHNDCLNHQNDMIFILKYDSWLFRLISQFVIGSLRTYSLHSSVRLLIQVVHMQWFFSNII